MVEQAHEVYLLTDSTKLDKVAFYQVSPIEKIDTLITDNQHDLSAYREVCSNVVAIDPKDYE